MKILFIAHSGNYHTIKWANWFANRGHDVHIISFMPNKIKGITVHCIDSGVESTDSDVKKIKYLFYAKDVKRIVNWIQPDIINVHYATSYGALAALSGIKNYILSVWGSDIYTFPRKIFFHKSLLKFSLKRATYLFSTSKAMAKEGGKYTDKNFYITPFGVDMELFNPEKKFRKASHENSFIVGTVKKMEPKYGIDYIIKAIKIIVDTRPDIPIKARIAGNGSRENEYKQLACSLNVNEKIDWLGFISQEEAAREWANMDIALVPSESESFGVAAVEAEACGTALIITDIPGLLEATGFGESSCVVIPRKNAEALAKAIIALYDQPERRMIMGYVSREFVKSKYEINKCFKDVENFFFSHQR